MGSESALLKKSMTVREMGQMLGLKKVESYWLVHKGYFETILVFGKMRVLTDSFEKWYRSQFHYKKVNGEPPGKDYEHTISIPEFAALIGVGSGSAYQLVQTQQLQVVVIAGKKRLFKQEVLGWIETHPVYKKQHEEVREQEWQEQQRRFILEGPEENEATPSKK